MHAELLAKQGNYHDVQVAFLKEEPLIDDCLKEGGFESGRHCA